MALLSEKLNTDGLVSRRRVAATVTAAQGGPGSRLGLADVLAQFGFGRELKEEK